MATILYKRHDCILKDSYKSTPIQKTQSNTQILPKNTLFVRRGIIRKQETSGKKIHSFTTVNKRKPVNLKRRLSVSLTNLSHTQQISDMSNPNSSNAEEKQVLVEMRCENLEPLVTDQRDLAKHVCKLFIVNAWRHRRLEAIKAKQDLKLMGTQMDNLNIQIIVLRNLLESEKERVASSMNEAAHVRVILEDERRQKDTLRSERDEKENGIKRLEEELQDSKTEIFNLRNELLTCKSEQTSLEIQMDKEREKLGKFREDKKLLLEKLKFAEENCVAKQTEVNRLENEKIDLQQILLVDRDIINATDTEVKESLEKLNALEESKSYLVKEVEVLKGTNSQLVERIESLEVALSKKDNENMALTKSCQDHLLEMHGLRVSLTQKQTSGWTSRLSRLASVLVQVPISVLFYNLNAPLWPVQT